MKQKQEELIEWLETYGCTKEAELDLLQSVVDKVRGLFCIPKKDVEQTTAKQIILDYLKKTGFDGLASSECGCGADSLIPCDCLMDNCQPAYRCECKQCKKTDCFIRIENGHCFAVKPKG
jgi:hypothetical protein